MGNNQISKENTLAKTGNEFMKGNSPDSNGSYGKYGGAFVPEMLFRNVEELRL